MRTYGFDSGSDYLYFLLPWRIKQKRTWFNMNCVLFLYSETTLWRFALICVSRINNGKHLNTCFCWDCLGEYQHSLARRGYECKWITTRENYRKGIWKCIIFVFFVKKCWYQRRKDTLKIEDIVDGLEIILKLQWLNIGCAYLHVIE